MEIKFLKIKYKNIREFDDLEISFLKRDGGTDNCHISLIQMPNGTGKTTTINLMKYAISGEVPSSDIIKSFAPKDKSAGDGFFELHMYVENQRCIIKLFFDYVESECTMYTTWPELEGGGRKKGHKLPSGIKHILTPEFTDLFIFDAELSTRLLDRKHSTANDAIEIIYNLNKLSQLNESIKQIVDKEQQTKASGVKSDQGLTQQKTYLDNLKQTRDDMCKTISELRNKIDENNKNLEEYKERENKYYAKYDNILREREIIIKNQVMVSASMTKNVGDFFNCIREPAQYSPFFHDELSELANNLVILKLPKTISTEFFKELANSKQCVCGESIDERHRQNILNNADKYLSDDDISVMNSVKSSIKEITAFKKMDELINDLANNQRATHKLRQDLDNLTAQLGDSDRHKASELKIEITNLKHTIENDEEMLDYLTTNDRIIIEDMSWRDNLYCCEQEIKKVETRIMEATNTMRFTRQAKRLREINDKIRIKSGTEIKTLIINESNIKLRKLLGTNDIVINSIDPSITIRDRDGVSQGQSLAIAYAYLATLFDDSKHKIPFVVDSPAGALDIDVRREVSSIIPELYDQLIIFILSGERLGFIEGIETYADIQYLTIYKNRADGTISTDCTKDFFMNFQSEGDDGIST